MCGQGSVEVVKGRARGESPAIWQFLQNVEAVHKVRAGLLPNREHLCGTAQGTCNM